MTPLEEYPFGKSSTPDRTKNQAASDGTPEPCEIVCRTKDGEQVILSDLDPSSLPAGKPLTIEIVSPCHLVLQSRIALKETPSFDSRQDAQAEQGPSHTAILRKEKRAEISSEQHKPRPIRNRRGERRIRNALILMVALLVGICMALLMRRAPDAASSLHDAARTELDRAMDRAVKGKIQDLTEEERAKMKDEVLRAREELGNIPTSR